MNLFKALKWWGKKEPAKDLKPTMTPLEQRLIEHFERQTADWNLSQVARVPVETQQAGIECLHTKTVTTADNKSLGIRIVVSETLTAGRAPHFFFRQLTTANSGQLEFGTEFAVRWQELVDKEWQRRSDGVRQAQADAIESKLKEALGLN